MPYSQRFGLSRLSPLNMTEKEEEKNPASEIIEDNNNKSNSNFTIDGTEYKTQSEHGMSDSEYRDQYEMGNIHNPNLDGVIIRSGVDYDDFYNKYGEDADFEEHMKKNLGPDLYKRSLAENFTKDPYYKDIMNKGLGTTNRKAFNADVNEGLDAMQEGLDYAGMVFPPADLANVGISTLRGGASILSGDFEGAGKHGKRALKSGVSTIPIFGDTFAAGTKLAKLNKFGQSKGRIYKPGMFMPESSKRNFARGFTNFALRKGQDTKFADTAQKGIQTVIGTSKPATFASKKLTENFLSGKPIAKAALDEDKKRT